VINPADLRIDRSDSRTIARLAGEIDLSNAALARRTISESIANHVVEVVIDLSDVHYIDSAGIAILFDLSRRLAEHDQRLTLVVPSTSLIRRSLEASGWPSNVPVVHSLDESIG
jgi:anti-sigma B factor antagonist